MKNYLEWMRTAEQIISDYDEGQKENSSQHNIIILGEPGTGKNYTTGWLKEHGLRKEDIKLIESHATEPSHLEEILEYMFPNGFFDDLRSQKLLEDMVTQFRRENYESADHSQDDVEELLEFVEQHSDPKACYKRLEKAIQEESYTRLNRRFREVQKLQEEYMDKLEDIREGIVENEEVPSEFRTMYAGESENYRFSMQVFTPTSRRMPQGEVPDFFQPYAVPVDDWAKHPDMSWGLQIIHGTHSKSFRRYRGVYDDTVVPDGTSYADMKNADTRDGESFVQEYDYGSGSIKATRVESERGTQKAFKRDWERMFQPDGIVCGTDFDQELTLRPQLKEALLSEDPQVIVLYTGFLSNSTSRRFAMTHFLETYKSIISSLDRSEVENLDKKFVVSMIEGQEAIVPPARDRQLTDEERVFNRFIRNLMNNSRHFNTDFWIDCKPDEVHDALISKSSHRIITRMSQDDLKNFSWNRDIKDKLVQAFDDTNPYTRLDEMGYGFVFMSGDDIPTWKRRNGRKTYGHRLPSRRMTCEDPVDRFGGGDWSFFLDELGMRDRGETIRFTDYQEKLFEEDWGPVEEEYIEKKRKEKQKQEQEKSELEDENKELQKDIARERVKTRVQQSGIPDSWTRMISDIMEELKAEDKIPEDYKPGTVMQWTKETRDRLEREAEQESAADLEKEVVADELVESDKFVFRGGSKEDKITQAKHFLVSEKDLKEEVADQVKKEVTQLAIGILQYPEVEPPTADESEILDNGLRVKVSRDEFEDWVDARNGEFHEPPGEEWTCTCGRLNEEDRAVCAQCGNSYEDVNP